MKRRDLLKGLFGVVGAAIASRMPAMAKPYTTFLLDEKFIDRKAVVEVLSHNPTTHYVKFKEFNTEQEAIEFVQSLIPELVKVTIKGTVQSPISASGSSGGWGYAIPIRSGYRGAVRTQFMSGHKVLDASPDIIRTDFVIVNRETGERIDTGYETRSNGAPYAFWDVSNAWAWLENIRVNGKPVNRVRHSSGISEYMIQPFRKAKDVVVEEV